MNQHEVVAALLRRDKGWDYVASLEGSVESWCGSVVLTVEIDDEGNAVRANVRSGRGSTDLPRPLHSMPSALEAVEILDAAVDAQAR